MQIKYPDRPLVYIDVDAIVLRLPELFWRMQNVDVAAYGRPHVGLYSGTLYFAPTDKARLVVDRWIEQCSTNIEICDQKHLSNVVQYMLDPERFGNLPPTYCWPVGAQLEWDVKLPDKRLVIIHLG